jgi:hypothetical protein
MMKRGRVISAVAGLLTVVLGLVLLVLGPQNFKDDEVAMSEAVARIVGPVFWIALSVTVISALGILIRYITQRRAEPAER